jgi:hypothetical protein
MEKWKEKERDLLIFFLLEIIIYQSFFLRHRLFIPEI